MKASKVLWALLLAAATAFGPTALASDETSKKEVKDQSGAVKLTVDQIVAKANHVAYYQAADGRARVKMTIVDAQKRTRRREITILRWDVLKPKKKPESQPAKKGQKEDEAVESAGQRVQKDTQFAGEQKFYVYFHAPADVNKMVFLVHKHLDKDDDRWLYLPKLDLVKRIAGSEKRTSFVGSDFFYEDISGRNTKDDKHELVQTTSKYYVLKNTPKNPKKVEFAYYRTWVHKKTFMVIKSEYYDRNGKPYRQYQARAVKQLQGYWTVMKARMTDLRTGRYTDVEYAGVRYDTGLSEDIFTERYLRRPPIEHLKN